MNIRALLLALAAMLALAGCQTADKAPEPTPIHWQLATFAPDRNRPGFAMNIPADWRFRIGHSGILLYNHLRALDLADAGAPMPSSSIVIRLSVISAADAASIGARNAAGLLDVFTGADENRAPKSQAGDFLDVGGRDVAQSRVVAGQRESLQAAIALFDHYLLALIVAPRGELPQHRDLITSIIGSVELRLAH